MIIYVGLGGVLGAITRYLLGRWISSRSGASFPFSTWVINLSGSFALGFLAQLYINHIVQQEVWLFAGIGFLGAYTTFSTFGYETIQLLGKRDLRKAAFYVLTSVLLGVILAWAGILAAWALT